MMMTDLEKEKQPLEQIISCAHGQSQMSPLGEWPVSTLGGAGELPGDLLLLWKTALWEPLLSREDEQVVMG